MAQITVLAACLAIAAWLVPGQVWAVLGGGAVALAANLVFGLLALTRRRSAGALIAAFAVAEIAKFAVVGLGFALLFRNFSERLDGTAVLLLFGAFIVTLGAHWAALVVIRADDHRRPGRR